MASEIGLRDVRLVANKVSGAEDVDFLSRAFPEQEFLARVPLCADIRRGDRIGHSVLDGLPSDVLGVFENILQRLQANAAT